MPPSTPSLEDDLPGLLNREFDLYDVAALLAEDHSHAEAALFTPGEPETISLDEGRAAMLDPGLRAAQQKSQERLALMYGDARTILAALIGSRRNHIATLKHLQLGSLLDRRPLRGLVDELLRQQPPADIAYALTSAKEAIVMHGVARPYVADLLRERTKRHALHLLHEAHIALEGFDGPLEDAIAFYVTDELMAAVGAGEEHQTLLGAVPPPNRPAGRIVPFRRPPSDPA